MNTRPPAGERLVLTPSQLNSEIRHALERGFPTLWIEGEISNLARPASGHLYFSLKDAQSQIRCAMFRNRNMLLRFAPANGAQVLVRARISVYEARGEYQLLVEHMEEAGHGALQRAFEALKAKLQAEGLFDASRKRALPPMPATIGVVTSPSGAAIRDILTTLRRRFPLARVIIYPSQVQGADAPAQLVRALRTAAQRAECDVLILARGGGSLEDLMAFNDEAVARAVAASSVPVVCGVGHEVDFSIADFVADVRAPTPTAAAELVAPDISDWQRNLDRLQQRLAQTLLNRVSRCTERHAWLQARLQQQHPGQRLRQQVQRLDELELRLGQGLRSHLRQRQHAVALLSGRLRERSPLHRVERLQERNASLARRIERSGIELVADRQRRIGELGRALNAVSPLATLGRGYAIIADATTGKVITRIGEIRNEQAVTGRLQDGEFQAVVKNFEEKNP
ncbi:MAG: exodeoxyribonuclease VII large subunit [Proteobacteria bacterium]|nr:exodeoxyribonuclease VII large subunit [Pseudomonadota bacterium]